MMSDFKLTSLRWTLKPVILVMTYCIWIILIRLLMLTLITYFMISPFVGFQDINETFSSNELALMGAGSIFFVCLIYWLKPMTTIERYEIISRPHIERQFLPGILNGIFIASFFVFILSIFGFYQNLGYLVQLHEAPYELGITLLRVAILAVFVYFEEFIFRYHLFRHVPKTVSEPLIVFSISLLFSLIKTLQFNISYFHAITLFLVSAALSLRVLAGESFSKGAGVWAGILITFHPLLSLPIFGNPFSGILFMKPGNGFQLLTGGEGGPLCSLGFQVLLILDMIRSVLRHRTPVFDKFEQQSLRKVV
jgi:hypothetical protein